jgi:DNA-binding protein YbaB
MPSYFEQFRAQLDASPVHGRSPRGYVAVTRDDRGEITVTIAPGTFRRLSHRQLTDEIRGALADAVNDYARTSDRLFHRWGGTW